MTLRILLVQTEMQSAQPLARFFTQRGDEVWQAWDLEQAWALIEQVKPHLLLFDLHFASAGWVDFLRRVRHSCPDIRIIMTNKYPDLQREMQARDQKVKVFLRQPFSARWIEQALNRLNEETPSARARSRSAAGPAVKGSPQKAVPIRPVRVPVRVKITLPYLLLTILFALGGAYVVSQVVMESVQDRFYNQLIETGRQSANWMVREEERLLETLRLVSNLQGVADAVERGNSERLRSLVLPVAVNAGEEALVLLDADGVSVLSLRRQPDGELQGYAASRGEAIFQQWDFVQQVAGGQVDSLGDKYAGVGHAPWGEYFYVSGPILDVDGRLAGIVLVGKSLPSIVRQMHQDTLGEATLYDCEGAPLASTLYGGLERVPLDRSLAAGVIDQQDEAALTRDLSVSTISYTEILAPWEARGGLDLGILGVSLAQAFFVRTSQITQVQIFGMVTFGIVLVLLTGMILASRITRPLVRLATASSEVAQGNLEIKVDANGDDEVAVLAQSFNYMIAGLQEGSIYRDLLGRTVSPEVREQLRQTFTSGNLRLEGQEAVATVLMSDIRGFTTLSEKADPATVFQWLNEYFAQIVPVVAAHGGVVNKFDGDAMLAFFGILPRMLSPRQSAQAACAAAVEVLEAVENLNRQRSERGAPPLITGIGVHTGVVIAGGLGTADRLHYTIIGDTVNTTQRIESLTRDLMEASGVLISESTYAALGGSQALFHLMSQGEHMVRGKQEAIQVYRLLSRDSQ